MRNARKTHMDTTQHVHAVSGVHRLLGGLWGASGGPQARRRFSAVSPKRLWVETGNSGLAGSPPHIREARPPRAPRSRRRHVPHPGDVDQEVGQFWSLLGKLAGKDSEIGVHELRTLLNEAFSKEADVKFLGFDTNTCREMISLMDSSGTGTLGPAELRTLWLKIQKYLDIYRETDHNHSGTIDAQEMRMALGKAGFTLSTQVQQTLALRYVDGRLRIDFDGFVACVTRLETLFKLFRLLDKDQSGTVRLSLAEWLCCVLV